MNHRIRQLCRLVAVAASVVLLATPSMMTARADADARSAIDWRQLGLSNKVELVGTVPIDVSVPVPAGVSPTILTGTVGSIVNATGQVDVRDARGVALGSFPLPSDVAAVPFLVDVSAAQVTAGVAKLSFVLRDDDDQRTDSCTQTSTATLSQLATDYSGAMRDPRTIADFLPGYLKRITIQVGPDPTIDQQQAALSLVAKLTRFYRPLPVRIDVATSAQPAQPAAPDTRVITVLDSPQTGVAVRDGGTPRATLEISGHGADLVRQVDLFADHRVLLAQTPSAAVSSVTDSVTKSTRIMTFAQLNMVAQGSVLGTTTLYTGFDAAAFAVGPIEGATVHLMARYTPVGGGEASLLMRAGSTVLATRVLDSTGTVDMSFDIPGQAITSNTGLSLELRYVPKQECAPLNDRLSFALSPDSTVTVAPGNGNRGGFPIFPMALTPEFDVALGNPAQLGSAATAVNLVGMQSTETLRPLVRLFDDAVKSGVPLLVVADAGQLATSGLTPPLQPGAANSVTVNGNPVTAVDLNGSLGVVQAFTDGTRSVLAVSASGDWTMVARGFDYIRGLDDRWASLSGDVVATGAENTVNLTLREGGPMADRPAPGDGWLWWGWSTLGIAVLAAVAVGLVLIRRRRRGNI